MATTIDPDVGPEPIAAVAASPPKAVPPDGAPRGGAGAVPEWLRATAGWSWRFLVVGAAVWVAVRALSSVAVVVLPMIVALLLTTLLLPPVRALKRRLPDGLATGLVMLVGLLGVGGLLGLIIPPVVDQFGVLGQQVRQGFGQLGELLANRPFNLSQAQVDVRVDQLLERLRDNSGGIGRGVVSGAVILSEVFTGLVITLLLTFFFLKDGGLIWGWIVSFVGERRSGPVQEIARRSFTALAGYVRGIAIVGLVDALLIGLALVVLGVPLIVPLMLLTFVGAFLPLIGAFVAGLAAVLIALVAKGVGTALLVLGATVLVQQLEGHLLYPALMSRTVHLHPAAIVLALATGGVLAGVIGVFLAVPAASVISVTLDYVRRRPRPGGPLADVESTA